MEKNIFNWWFPGSCPAYLKYFEKNEEPMENRDVMKMST